MQFSQHRCLRRGATILAVTVAGAVLAACGSSGPKSVTYKKAARSKEYFSESEYGVKASPRVTNQRSRLKRGGGRDQIGKPYKVKGKWYYPKEDKNYRKSGAASWYGDAFHGRLTANGEIYDMTHLTAAHPTMPLPSYARVTNLRNGSSVVVRVNDRGPYADGRIIDLSKRAAELLDYTHAGVAKVQVEYLGRAPLHGQDDQYLMASYRPGKGQGPAGVPDPSDGLPTGVMVAMAGPTPSGSVGGAGVAFTAGLAGTRTASTLPTYSALGSPPGDPMLPDFGPIAPERPLEGWGLRETQVAMAELSYADHRVRTASAAFSAFDRAAPAMSADALVAVWKARHALPGEYVAVGAFEDGTEAERLAERLRRFGSTSIQLSTEGGSRPYSLDVRPGEGVSIDAILEAAWAAGASNAFAVRD